jgi:hypothetical protein
MWEVLLIDEMNIIWKKVVAAFLRHYSIILPITVAAGFKT